MEWKEFYKFTWTKLILFVLIVIIPGFFILQQAGISDGPPAHPLLILVGFILFWPFLLMLVIEKLIFTSVDWIHGKDIPFILLALIINVIYIYTIASLIVFSFRKIKK